MAAVRPPPASAGALDPRVPPIVYAGTFEAYQGIDIWFAHFAACESTPQAPMMLLIGGTPAQVAEMRALADRRALTTRSFSPGRRRQEVGDAASRHSPSHWYRRDATEPIRR